jgi:hypothetical protein
MTVDNGIGNKHSQHVGTNMVRKNQVRQGQSERHDNLLPLVFPAESRSCTLCLLRSILVGIKQWEPFAACGHDQGSSSQRREAYERSCGRVAKLASADMAGWPSLRAQTWQGGQACERRHGRAVKLASAAVGGAKACERSFGAAPLSSDMRAQNMRARAPWQQRMRRWP